jgi:hypothetical protein
MSRYSGAGATVPRAIHFAQELPLDNKTSRARRWTCFSATTGRATSAGSKAKSPRRASAFRPDDSRTDVEFLHTMTAAPRQGNDRLPSLADAERASSVLGGAVEQEEAARVLDISRGTSIARLSSISSGGAAATVGARPEAQRESA